MATLAGREITSKALGLMRLTWDMDPLPDDICFKVLKAALANGANIWNGADFYGNSNANSLHMLNRYFTAYPEDAEKVILCIKTGIVSFAPPTIDCSPEYMRRAVQKANEILDGKKFIDIFGPARVDPKVPIEETIAALGALVDEGKIGGIQLSEVRASTIRRAADVYRIDMVEAEVSIWARDVFSNGVAEVCHELGIVVAGHTPLAAGVLAGDIQTPDGMHAKDYHKLLFPRFQGDNFKNNLKLVNELKVIAREKGCSTAQLALGWVKAQGQLPGNPFVTPVPGARSVERVVENYRDVELDDSNLRSIETILAAYPVQGERCPPAAFAGGLEEY